MNDFNLIPPRYMQRMARLRLVHHAGLAVALTLTVGFGARLGLGTWIDDLKADVAVLQKRQEVSAQQRETIVALNRENQELEQQWLLLESLRSGMPAKQMMQSVQAAMRGDDVWFIDWRLRRAGIVTAQEPTSNRPGYFVIVKKQPKPEDWRSATHMTIKGQARDHSRLSEFAQRLLEQPNVEDVRVQRTAQTSKRAEQAVVVDFDLAIVFRADSGDQA